MLELIDRPPTASVPSVPAPLSEHPSARMDAILFARRDAGDPRAREQLIERFLPLARSIARRYERSDEPLDDLIQIASLGLVKAIDRFDPALGNAFSSYAVPTMTGELKRYFRDRTWAVRPPRGLQALTLRVERTTTRLTAQLDRAPTVKELASATGSSDEEILEALQARGGRDALSLQAPSGRHGQAAMLGDMLGAGDDGYGQAESRAMLEELMTGLPRRTRDILRLRFEADLTQAEIGARFGVSQMQISRIIRHALEQLRETADHHEQMRIERSELQPV